MSTPALTAIEGALLRWVCTMHRHPVAALVGCFSLAVLGLVCAAMLLRINTDASDMINPNLAYRQAMDAFDEAFPYQRNNILVLVRAPTPDQSDAFTEAFAERLEGITDHVKTAYAPAANEFFARNGLLFLDDQDLLKQLQRMTRAGSLIESLNQNPSLEGLFASLKRSAGLLQDAEGFEGGLDPVYRELSKVVNQRLNGKPVPFSWQLLLRPKDDEEIPEVFQRVISVTPVLDFTSLQPAREAAAAIRAEAERFQAEGDWEGVEVSLTGNPILRTEELRSVSDGIELSLIVSAIAVTVLLWLVFRSTSMALISLLTLLVSLLITAGFAALTVGALNLISIAFAVLLIGLGIDFAIHFGLHMLETRRHGMGMGSTLETTAHEVGSALALAAPTTAFAFFAFVPTDFIGMAQLGIISGAGVLIAFLVAITVLPAMASLLPAPRRRLLPPMSSAWARFSEGPWGRALALLVGVALVGSFVLLPKVRFDADPMELRDPKSPSVIAFNHLFEDQRTVPYRLNALAKDKETAQVIGDKLKTLQEVDQTISILSFIPKNQDTKLESIMRASFSLGFALEEPAEAPETPPLGPNLDALMQELSSEDPGTPATHLLKALQAFNDARAQDPDIEAGLQEDVFRFWSYQMGRLRRQLEGAAPVSYETVPASIKDRFVTEDGRARLEIVPADYLDMKVVDDRRTFVEAVSAIEPTTTGTALNLLRAGEVVSRAMLTATIVAGVVVLALLWALLRHFVMVLLIMLPVMLAAVFTSAAGVLLGMPYNFANVIVIPLLIGLGADNGIHLALRSAKMTRHSAVFSTTTPRAVLFSALTTIASFGSLMLSSHRGTSSMGTLLTISLGFTLFTTLLVLPAAMDAVNRRWPLRKL